MHNVGSQQHRLIDVISDITFRPQIRRQRLTTGAYQRWLHDSGSPSLRSVSLLKIAKPRWERPERRNRPRHQKSLFPFTHHIAPKGWRQTRHQAALLPNESMPRPASILDTIPGVDSSHKLDAYDSLYDFSKRPSIFRSFFGQLQVHLCRSFRKRHRPDSRRLVFNAS